MNTRHRDLLRLASRTERDVAILAASGELDSFTAPRLAAVAETLLITHGRLVLDLAGVSYLGTDGLWALLAAHRHARRSHGRLVLAVLPVTVIRRLQLSGLTDVFTTADTTDTAVTALAGG